MDLSKLSNEELFKAAGINQSIDPLTAAQIQVESGGNPNAVSPAGAQGLMQVMPKTGVDPGYGVAPLQNNSPEENVRFGVDYRNAMLKKYGGNQSLALAAYNAGPKTVDDYLAGKRSLPLETQNYVAKLTGPSIQTTSALQQPNSPDLTQLSDEDLFKAAGVQPPQQEIPPTVVQESISPSFAERLATDFAKRSGKQGEISAQAANGEISQFSNILQQAGQGAGTVLDVGKEAVSSLPEIVRNNVITRTAGQAAQNMMDDFGVSFALNKAGQGYKALESVAPEAAHDLAAVGQLAQVIVPPALKGASAVEAGAQGLARAGEGIATGAGKLDIALGKTIRPNAQELKSASQASYKAVEAKGANFIPKELADSYIDDVQKILPANPKEAAAFGLDDAQKLAQNLDSYRGAPLTLDEATSLDRKLTDFIHTSGTTEGKINPSGYKALDMQTNLREKLDGFDGGEEYKTAIKDWRAQAQASDIERIINGAQYYDNAATNMKAGFRAIAKNPNRLNKYPKDVQLAIQRAANGNAVDFIRTTLGSRLISAVSGASVGGAAAGPLGAILGTVGGAASSGVARAAAEKIQLSKANKVLDAIAANSSLPSRSLPRSQVTREALQEAFKKKKGN